MAKIIMKNSDIQGKKLTLLDCSRGDIVSIPSKGLNIGIICDCEYQEFNYVPIIDLTNGEMIKFLDSIPCRRYNGAIAFDNNLFEENL